MKKVITQRCSVDSQVLKHWASVSIHVTNPWHVYKGSGRPFVYIWQFKLCKKHLRKFFTTVKEFLSQYMATIKLKPETVNIIDRLIANAEIEEHSEMTEQEFMKFAKALQLAKADWLGYKTFCDI